MTLGMCTQHDLDSKYTAEMETGMTDAELMQHNVQFATL